MTRTVRVPVGVGDHDIRAMPSDFDDAAQSRRIRGGDFVQDHARGTRTQLHVAAYPTAEFRLRFGSGVVQNDAVGMNAEVFVLISRYTARAGRGDVD